jgi:hypothetical protein
MRPKHELTDVLKACPDWSSKLPLNARQKKAFYDVQRCRTAEMGAHLDDCQRCGEIRISYNSCRSRSCPKCQATYREKWMLNREADLLNVPYFHLVFTLPHELNGLALSYPALVYNCLFRAAWQTLELFGQQTLQGRMGMTSILHTWGQNLSLHPHLHCIVPGGAWRGGDWHPTDRTGKYLFPAKALAKVFRAKYAALLRKGLKKHQWEEDPKLFEVLFTKEWVIYAKRPFGGAKQVVEYLGRYSHKIAISNHRLVAVDGKSVLFSYKDYRKGGQKLRMRLSPDEFLRRYAQHVLPRGFMRIRHYGFLSSSCKQQALEQLRERLGQEPPAPIEWDWVKLSQEKLGYDPLQCPSCGERSMRLASRSGKSQRAPPKNGATLIQ